MARRISALVAGLLLGLALAEVAARCLTPVAGEELYYGGAGVPPPAMFRYAPQILKEPIPGASGVVRAQGNAVLLRFNSVGTRGAEPEPGPKWVAVGDSFTLGEQVDETDTFEARLRPMVGAEVLNAGVNDYSVFQAAGRYAKLARAVDVDGVILTFYLGNDLLDNERYQHLARLPAWKVEPVTESPSWVAIASQHSMLAAWFQVAMGRARLLDMADPQSVRFRKELTIWSHVGAHRLNELERFARTALTQLREAAAANGDRVVVAIAPPAFALDPEMFARLMADFGLPDPTPDAPRDLVQSLAASLGLPTCDLTPALSDSHARGDKPYLRFDGHWSAAGHAVVAETLAECISDTSH